LSSARKAGLEVLAFEARLAPDEPGRIDIFERIDVDDSIQTIGDCAGDDRHRPATRTYVKGGGAAAERVSRHECDIFNGYRQPGARVGGPNAAVLDAERATALARTERRHFAFPFKLECDITAVAFAMDSHGVRRAQYLRLSRKNRDELDTAPMSPQQIIDEVPDDEVRFPEALVHDAA
jgi:hypothetical protein